jgi:hypothetical protein
MRRKRKFRSSLAGVSEVLEVHLPDESLTVLARAYDGSFYSERDFALKMFMAGVKAEFPDEYEEAVLLCPELEVRQLGKPSVSRIDTIEADNLLMRSYLSTLRAELTELRSLINTSKEGE